MFRKAKCTKTWENRALLFLLLLSDIQADCKGKSAKKCRNNNKIIILISIIKNYYISKIAFILLTHLELASSFCILNFHIIQVFATCGPQQSSLLQTIQSSDLNV